MHPKSLTQFRLCRVKVLAGADGVSSMLSSSSLFAILYGMPNNGITPLRFPSRPLGPHNLLLLTAFYYSKGALSLLLFLS